VPERRLRIFLDENVPRAVADWLRSVRPDWLVEHVSEVGLDGKSDREVFDWAQQRGAIVATFDEDFADRRLFPVGEHHGVIRLRVWPTTVEVTQEALDRLLALVPEASLRGALVIVDNARIRIRRKRTS
jgi:predicted nuclease of predicted toxin-antitoxin system